MWCFRCWMWSLLCNFPVLLFSSGFSFSTVVPQRGYKISLLWRALTALGWSFMGRYFSLLLLSRLVPERYTALEREWALLWLSQLHREDRQSHRETVVTSHNRDLLLLDPVSLLLSGFFQYSSVSYNLDFFSEKGASYTSDSIEVTHLITKKLILRT